MAKHHENIKQILLNSNATPIIRRAGFKCCFCSEEYIDPSDLKRHTLENHNDGEKSSFMEGASILSYVVRLDITNLECSICKTQIRELEDLIEHLRSQHGKTYHLDIDNHIVPFRFDSDEFRCVICNNVFNHVKGLSEHMNVHYKNHICGVCGAGFINKKHLRSHGYRHETGEFRCSTCLKVFDTKIKKSDHERSVHTNLKRNKCWYCGERFASHTAKKEHEVKVHGATPISLNCNACDRTFSSQRALSAHTKTYHLIVKRKSRVKKEKDNNQ